MNQESSLFSCTTSGDITGGTLLCDVVCEGLVSPIGCVVSDDCARRVFGFPSDSADMLLFGDRAASSNDSNFALFLLLLAELPPKESKNDISLDDSQESGTDGDVTCDKLFGGA